MTWKAWLEGALAFALVFLWAVDACYSSSSYAKNCGTFIVTDPLSLIYCALPSSILFSTQINAVYGHSIWCLTDYLTINYFNVPALTNINSDDDSFPSLKAWHK